jgi:predicted O-linked N-acetylglucosamine transferase (SPINDLY family)
VLSFHGDRWASRTTASLLRAAGLQDWIMSDQDAYVRQAISLAGNPPDLSALRQRRSAGDPEILCRSLELFYRICGVRRNP